jgi:cytochrome P450
MVQNHVIVALGCAACLTITAIAHRSRRKRQLAKCPPGNLGLYGIGEMLSFLWSPITFDQDRQDRYGLNYLTHIFLKPVVRIGNVEDRKHIYNMENKGQLIPQWPDHVYRLFGKESIVNVTGEKHMFLRKLFHAAFTPTVLRAYTKVVEETMEVFVDGLSDGKLHGRKDFNRVTLDIFFKTAFGENVLTEAEMDALSSDFQTWIDGFKAIIPFEIPGTIYKKSLDAKGRLFATVTRLIKGATQGSGNDLLSKMVNYRDETGEALSMDALRDNLIIVIIAGYESTAASLGTLTSFVFDPKNARVLDELRGIAQRVPDTEAWKANEYVAAVMDEAWRAVTPVNSSIRVALEEIKLADGTIVPKGECLSTYPGAIHFYKEVWGDDVRSFNPERMLRVRKEHPNLYYQYFSAFGGGARICVGEQLARLEVRTFLYYVAKKRLNFRLAEVLPKELPVNRIECTFTSTNP